MPTQQGAQLGDNQGIEADCGEPCQRKPAQASASGSFSDRVRVGRFPHEDKMIAAWAEVNWQDTSRITGS